MKPILLPRSPLLLALIVVACSDRPFTDETCYSDVDPTPVGTSVGLAIFDQRGQPVCASARITAQQGRGPEFVLARASNNYAELSPDGHHGLRWGASCNAYEGVPGGGPGVPGLLRCSDPLNWRVEAEGCEPARGSWSWNDNTFPGSNGISFQVTVRLRCNGVSDGGVGADASTDAGADASADARSDAGRD